MTRSASQVPTGNFLDSYDFSQNYRYLKKLIQELKKENSESVRKEIFGEAERGPRLTRGQMQQLFRFLRKVERHYEACSRPPVPEEMEKAIRNRDSSEWLPYEKEALEKVQAWREELQDRKKKARRMLNSALEKVRRGEEIL